MYFYKEKYLKYKTKYLQLKNQKGGNFYSEFLDKYPYEKEPIDSSNIKIKFIDNTYNVNFNNNIITFTILDEKILELQKEPTTLVILHYNGCLNLLKEILKMYELQFCQFFEKYFDDEDLFKYKKTSYYFLLNKHHEKYLETKQMFIPHREKFFNKISFPKEKQENKFYFTFDSKTYKILDSDDPDDIVIQLEDKIILKFKLFLYCMHFTLIKEYDDSLTLLNEILKMYNLTFAKSDFKICDKCIEFNNEYIYLNETHELYDVIRNVLSKESYLTDLGISKDLLTEKLYSINFIWLRINSFTEICFSIMGEDDTWNDINSVENIMKLQTNDFFVKLINFSKNNPNSLVNFWIDCTQVKTETIINLRLVFDTLNRNLGLNLCVRDVWNLKITNTMNEKYPDILPKCSGISLILKVDLYKCIICVEELERHTYSVFADLDMKPIGQDIILSGNCLRILNRIGLVLTNIANIFENGFQILGSTIPKIRCGVIETFNIFLIERTMVILSLFKNTHHLYYSNESYYKTKTEQLVYVLYKPMYKYLYYTCGHGLYYVSGRKIITTLSKEELNDLRENDFEFVDKYLNGTAELTNFGWYISYELINDKMNFSDEMEEYEIIQQIKKYNSDEQIKNYKDSLADVHTSATNIIGLPVKKTDLISFEDKKTLPTSSRKWPFTMCKKYIKL